MKKLVSLLLVAMLVLGLVACGPAATTPTGTVANTEASTGAAETHESYYGGTLNVAWVGEGAKDYKPLTSGNGNYIWTTAVYEGILSRDSQGNLHPGVCDFTLSDDQLELTLTVREGVKFHNGDPVTMKDIWATIYGNKDGKMEENVRDLLVEEIPCPDDSVTSLTLKFKEYNASTLYYLSQNATYLSVLPYEVFEANCGFKHTDDMTDADWDALDDWTIEDMVGTGPYMIDTAKWEEGYKIVLTKYNDYVQKDATLTGMAGARYGFFDTINIWYNSDENAVAMGLMNGTYDISSVSVTMRDSLLEKGLTPYSDPSKKIVYAAFNTSSHTMQDANLRKAIAAALDYSTVMTLQVGAGCFTEETSMMAEGAYWTNKFSEVDYAGAANLDLAKQYLAQSAYAGETVKFMYEEKQADLAAYIKEVLENQLGLTYVGDAKTNADWKSAYAKVTNPEYDFDFIIAASAQSELLPSNLVTNLRTRFWECDAEYAKEAFSVVGSLPYGSAESIAKWDEMSTKWAEDAHIVPLGCNTGSWYAQSDLVLQFPGAFVAFYNCYWGTEAKRA